ncbi:MAG TPA: hypothetical protein PKN27_05530 [Propionibacteriaceae bacterium]|nr:hypothetical protein [Propionibacteriaceae bacterium]
MIRNGASNGGTGDPAELTRALFASLGLPDDAGRDEIGRAHEALTAFLASAPDELAGWAAQQSVAAEAAFTLLSGRTPTAATTTDSTSEADDRASDPDPDADDVPLRPRSRPATRSAAPVSGRPGYSTWARAGLVVAIVAVVVGVYFMGDRTPATQASVTPTASSTATPVDVAKVTALMDQLSDDPENVGTMKQLADLYSAADEWKSAAVWRQKVVDLAPADVEARLVLGVAYFNSSNLADAEAQWLKVVELDPKAAEAYYDLGFLYLSSTPSDPVTAKQMWRKVVEIDPESDIAKVVAGHIAALDASPSPSASGR